VWTNAERNALKNPISSLLFYGCSETYDETMSEKRKRSADLDEPETIIMNRRAAPGFHDLPEAEDDDVAQETFDSHNNSVIHEEATISLMVLGCIAGIATVIILLSAVLLWRRKETHVPIASTDTEA